MNYAKKVNSPIGTLYLVANEAALIALDNVSNDLFKSAQLSDVHEILNLTHKQLDEYFTGTRTEFNVPIDPMGSEFQKKVWNVLMKIPYGSVWSYGKQAQFMKVPKAARAVGGANGKNPIPIIIPCHRVVGSTGKLIGYSNGIQMKIELLKKEGHLIEGTKIISTSTDHSA